MTPHGTDHTDLVDPLEQAIAAYREAYVGPPPAPSSALAAYLGTPFVPAQTSPRHPVSTLRTGVCAAVVLAVVGALGMVGALPAAAQTVFDRIVTVLTPLDRGPGPHRDLGPGARPAVDDPAPATDALDERPLTSGHTGVVRASARARHRRHRAGPAGDPTPSTGPTSTRHASGAGTGTGARPGPSSTAPDDGDDGDDAGDDGPGTGRPPTTKPPGGGQVDEPGEPEGPAEPQTDDTADASGTRVDDGPDDGVTEPEEGASSAEDAVDEGR